MTTRNPAARGRADTTQPDMVEWLEQNGFLVQFLGIVGLGCPDLLIGTPWGELVLVECKSPGGRLTPQQREWHTRWQRFPRCMPKSVTELRGWMEKRRKAYFLRERAA